MKHILSILFVVSYAIGVHAQDGQITHELKDFSEIKAFDGLSVNLIKSDVNRAVITGANTKKSCCCK